MLLTERAASLRSHPGQVSFPGGTVDPQDDGPVGAALREAAEETGLNPAGVEVVGLLPELYLHASDHRVTPVLAWWRAPSPVTAVDPAEVARVELVPVAELIDPGNRFSAVHPRGYRGPAFAVRGLAIWGFTAELLSRVLELSDLALPWDRSRVIPVARLDEASRAGGGGS
ncbi:MAG: NUDIX hydrolase [Angustibacter sp.]